MGISAVSQEVGSESESVPVTSAKDSGGEGIEISFSPEYLTGAARTCRASLAATEKDGVSGKVLFRLNDPLKPAVIEPEGDSAVTLMVMPIKNPNAGVKVGATPSREEKAAGNQSPESQETEAPELGPEKLGAGSGANNEG